MKTTNVAVSKQPPLQIVCDTAAQLWAELHDHSNNIAAPQEARGALPVALGFGVFRYCSEYCNTRKPPRCLNKSGGGRLYRFISAKFPEQEVYLRVSESIDAIVDRAVNLRAHLMLEGHNFPEIGGYQAVIDLLIEAACALIETGAIRQLNDSLLKESSRSGADRRLARVLVDRHQVTQNAALELAKREWSKEKIALALKLSIFSAVSGIENEPTRRRRVLALERLQAENQRLQRSFYCGISAGLEELASIHSEINRRIALLERKKSSNRSSVEDQAEIGALEAIRGVIGLSIIQILNTGFLEALPR